MGNAGCGPTAELPGTLVTEGGFGYLSSIFICPKDISDCADDLFTLERILMGGTAPQNRPVTGLVSATKVRETLENRAGQSSASRFLFRR